MTKRINGAKHINAYTIHAYLNEYLLLFAIDCKVRSGFNCILTNVDLLPLYAPGAPRSGLQLSIVKYPSSGTTVNIICSNQHKQKLSNYILDTDIVWLFIFECNKNIFFFKLIKNICPGVELGSLWGIINQSRGVNLSLYYSKIDWEGRDTLRLLIIHARCRIIVQYIFFYIVLSYVEVYTCKLYLEFSKQKYKILLREIRRPRLYIGCVHG